MRPPVVAIATLCGLLRIASGCGRDPILEKAEAEAKVRAEGKAAERSVAQADARPPGVPGVPGVPGAAEGAPAPGIPEEPKPGVPSAPAPGAPGAPGAPVAPTPGQGAAGLLPPGVLPPGVAGSPPPGIPSQPTPGIPSQPPPGGGFATNGPTVSLSGTIVFPSYKNGKVRITGFNSDHAANTRSRPDVIGMAEIAAPGPFTMTVPQNAGKIYLEASVDENGDGRPGPLDPQGKADRFPVTAGTAPVTGLTVTLTRREPPPGGRGTDF